MGVVAISPKTDRVLGLLSPLIGRMTPTGEFALPGDLANDSRVLIIDSGELTEILFFAPVLRFLKRKYPGMRVTFLVREGNSELVRTMGEINEMITYEPGHLSLTSTTFVTLVRRLRRKDFGVAFLLGSEFNVARAVLSLATRARVRVGFASESSWPYVNCEVRPASKYSYEGSKIRAFLTILGGGFENAPGWTLPDQDARWAKQRIHFHKPNKKTKFIVVDPGLGKGQHRLVDDSFAYLVNQLCMRMTAKVLVLSNNLDDKRMQVFKSALSVEMLGLEPKNVKEALALLSGADLFLSGNTDFFHFAVSMRIPTLGLFTRHDEGRWFPKNTPWVQILQGVKGQRVSLDEFNSKIDTLLHLAHVE